MRVQDERIGCHRIHLSKDADAGSEPPVGRWEEVERREAGRGVLEEQLGLRPLNGPKHGTQVHHRLDLLIEVEGIRRISCLQEGDGGSKFSEWLAVDEDSVGVHAATVGTGSDSEAPAVTW